MFAMKLSITTSRSADKWRELQALSQSRVVFAIRHLSDELAPPVGSYSKAPIVKRHGNVKGNIRRISSYRPTWLFAKNTG